MTRRNKARQSPYSSVLSPLWHEVVYFYFSKALKHFTFIIYCGYTKYEFKSSASVVVYGITSQGLARFNFCG